MPEESLLRDLIYVFQGVDGKFIKFHPKFDAYVVSPQHGVPVPVRNLVLKIAELGWMYRRVKEYVERTTQSSVGLFEQSFCGALQQELTEYYRMIA